MGQTVWAKQFGEAYGAQAKTDPADAEVLARMAQALDLPETRLESETQLELKALQVARQALIKDRTAARTRQEHLHLTLPKRQNARRLAQIEKDLTASDTRITALVEADADLAERKASLMSLKGISNVTAQALLTLLPKIGRLDGPQIAKLAGVAPITRRSATWGGRLRLIPAPGVKRKRRKGRILGQYVLQTYLVTEGVWQIHLRVPNSIC